MRNITDKNNEQIITFSDYQSLSVLCSNNVFSIGLLQVWQMAENIYNDEEPETPASELEAGAS